MQGRYQSLILRGQSFMRNVHSRIKLSFPFIMPKVFYVIIKVSCFVNNPVRRIFFENKIY